MRKPRMIWISLIAAAAFSAGGVAYALSGGADSTQPQVSENPTHFQTEQQVVAEDKPSPGSVTHEGRVADPGGRAPWTVRAYRNPAGDICTDVGQLDAGRFGEDRRSGFARKASLDEMPTGCDSLAQDPFGVRIVTREGGLTGDGGRTIVYGEVDLARVDRVLVDGPGGPRDLSLSQRGTFITVYDGALPEAPKVTVKLTDGGSRLVNP